MLFNKIKEKSVEKNIIDFYKKTSSKKRFLNVMKFCEYISTEQKARYDHWIVNPVLEKKYDPFALYSVMKLFTDKIVFDNIRYIIESNKERTNNEDYLGSDFNSYFKANNDEMYEILTNIKEIRLPDEKELIVRLGKDPIITHPRTLKKLDDKFVEFSSDKKPWIEQTDQKCLQHIKLYLPMGLSIVVKNGNHSVSLGMVKSDGIITIDNKVLTDGEAKNKVLNMSALYDLIEFDGEHFVKRKSKKRMTNSVCFEFGVAFEIGRLIHNSPVKYFEV